MYIILDESGNTNPKSNNYFIIGGYICKNITKIRSIHKKIEKAVKLDKKIPLKRQYELKATNLSSVEKAQFLNALLKESTVRCFCIYYDVRDNNILKNLKSSNDKFNYLVKNLIDNIFFDEYDDSNYNYIATETNIDIYLDNRSVKVNYKNKLKKYLEYNLKITEKDKEINHCSYYISNNRREIQMADIVVNTFWSHLNYPKTESTIKLVNKWNIKTKIYNYPKHYIAKNN